MTWMQFASRIIVGFLSSTGFWTLVNKKMDKNDARDKLLLGIAGDIIITKCDKYIERGYASLEEHTFLENYLYDPYKANHGDGAVDAKWAQYKKSVTIK